MTKGSSAHQPTHHLRDNFFDRFQKNLVVELEKSFEIFFDIFRILRITCVGFLVFLYGFTITNKIHKIVVPILITFFVVTYLTLLPPYASLFFIFLPSKRRIPLLLLSVVYAFFATIMI